MIFFFYHLLHVLCYFVLVLLSELLSKLVMVVIVRVHEGSWLKLHSQIRTSFVRYTTYMLLGWYSSQNKLKITWKLLINDGCICNWLNSFRSILNLQLIRMNAVILASNSSLMAQAYKVDSIIVWGNSYRSFIRGSGVAKVVAHPGFQGHVKEWGEGSTSYYAVGPFGWALIEGSQGICCT